MKMKMNVQGSPAHLSTSYKYTHMTYLLEMGSFITTASITSPKSIKCLRNFSVGVCGCVYVCVRTKVKNEYPPSEALAP